MGPRRQRSLIRVRLLAILLIVGIVLPARALAARGEELPTGHPIYELLERYESVTGALAAPAGREPLTRGELRDALFGDEGAARDSASGDSAWAAALRAEIASELGDLPAAGEAPYGIGRLGLRSQFEVDRGGRSRLRETLRGEAAVDFNRWVSFWQSFEFDTHGERDTDFQGTRWEDALTGRVDRAGIAVRGEHVALVWGRSAARWGPGHGGSLILSSTAPPLDRLELDLSFGPAHLAAFAAPLGALEVPPTVPIDGAFADSAGIDRRISAHRLSLRFPPRIEFGLSEVVVYGGPSRGFEAYYLQPLVPYYAEQWNRGAEDNILWSADATWAPGPGHKLWGEFLVDDFQFDFTTEPHQVGWTIGAETALPKGWVPRTLAAFEVSRIESYVYGHQVPWNRYLHEGRVLGYPSGPDFEGLAARVTHDLGERTTAGLAFAASRHGARSAATPQDAVSPHGEPFPTPPASRRLGAELSASWRPRPTRRIEAEVAYADEEGVGAGWSGRLAVTLRIDRDARPGSVSSRKEP